MASHSHGKNLFSLKTKTKKRQVKELRGVGSNHSSVELGRHRPEPACGKGSVLEGKRPPEGTCKPQEELVFSCFPHVLGNFSEEIERLEVFVYHIGVMYLFELWFSLDICPVVGLLDHMVIQFLVF